VRTDDRLHHTVPFIRADHGPLSQWAHVVKRQELLNGQAQSQAQEQAQGNGGHENVDQPYATTPQVHLDRVTAALCTNPLVLTNATDLWASAVHSLQLQGLSLSLLCSASTDPETPDDVTPWARHTLLVDGCVALILCTNTTADDLHTRIAAAQASKKVRAVLCAGVQAWIWHVTNEATEKPVHGVRLVHVLGQPIHPGALSDDSTEAIPYATTGY